MHKRKTHQMNLYFAAPLFTASERWFNLMVADLLAPYAEVFLPQRDGSLLVEMVRAGVNPDVAERRVYQQDCEHMKTADVLVAVLDGAHIDEGVAFELGFARALNRVCLGLQTDVRRALPTGNNPMVKCGLDRVFAEPKALCAYVEMLARDITARKRA
jgi:nucleoside 2-deoxyribosyltransferase